MLIHSIFLALGLTATLYLFLSLKREIQISGRKQRKRFETIEKRLIEASAEIPLPAPRSGFNLNKRLRATRMLRRGEDLAHIAAALGVPRKEVELLIRVQGIVTQPRPSGRG
jgi:hypothetical protein